MTKAHGQIERGCAKAKIRFLPTHGGGIPIEGLGIIDTGATGSTIDGDSATVGRFRPLGEANSYTASQSNVLLRVWDAEIELLDFPGEKFRIHPTEWKPPPEPTPVPSNQKTIALIGYDVLKHFCFTFDGPNGTFTLEMP